ncbi:MAG: DUF4366 domain-containing protein [Lachnospiraceae bacterium]|nr:DUF4366 domain-containing protein [Lachnospiraceae bacterium]
MLNFEKYKNKLESIDAGEIKDRIADIVAGAKVGELFKKNEQPVVVEEKKEKSTLVCILAIIGAIVAVAAIAYGVYRFCIRKPDYLEDFDDDDFDDFDDLDDEEEEAEDPVTE